MLAHRTSEETVRTEPPSPSTTDLPDEFTLQGSYPNPFNPTTTIRFTLPEESEVRLTVYDVLGREVMVLVQETREAGTHEAHFDASHLASGLYLYRLEALGEVLTGNMLLVK